MNITNKNNKGFTLIELLVVVAIIGLLASVILASLNTARAKGRDAKRLSDLEQIRTALAMYYIDHNGTYPSTGGSWYGDCPGWGSQGTSGAGGYIPNLAPTYIPVLPLDPNPIGNYQCYLYNSNGVDYMALIGYSTVEENVRPVSLNRPQNPNELDYAIYTPGASSW